MGWLEVFVFLLGLVGGSFLNVVAWRIPRRESLVKPGSHCPECGHPLGSLELIPVAGFLWLRGRCRHCGARIPPRYPLLELATATLFLLLFWKFGPTGTALFYACLVLVLLATTCTDLMVRLIPNRILLAGLAAGLALLAVFRPESWLDAGIGLLVGGGLSLLAAEISRGGLGYGDVKLSGVIGFFLGWPNELAALFLAVLSGAAVGLGLVLAGVKTRKDYIPFGPFLALGALIGLFWGQALIHWYLSLVTG